ncbi:MAG: LysM peptidoglycan-binding domain-containing protein [Bacteroidota bacterium]
MIRKFLFPIFLAFSANLIASDLPTLTVPGNVEIMNVKLKISAEAQREIQKEIDNLRRSPKYFNIKLDRANLYFPVIEKILKEEGVPDDLKFLSLQESALIADQVSSSDAVGYWQFKDFTAREVGMRVDSKIDERKNVVSSTRGAAKYMKQNNFMLKNWIYSVNAYMTGVGGVKPYIDQDGIGSDKLTITHKTHWYVKRFIAHVIAFRDDVGRPHSEGMELMIYHQGGNKDLKEISKKLEVDEDLVHQYNKWLSYGKVPDDRTYPVIIPVKGNRPKIPESEIVNRPVAVEKAAPPRPVYPEEIVEEISTMGKTLFLEINDRKTILAIPGDDFKSLASKSGTSIEKLRKYNDLPENQVSETGQFYFTESKRNQSKIRYHVTQYDETLWEVSQRYGIKLKKLKSKNRIEENEPVRPGLILWLKQKRPKDIPPAYRKIEVPVAPKPDPPKPVQKFSPPVIEETPKQVMAEEENEVISPPTTTAIDREEISETRIDSVQAIEKKIDVHEVTPGQSLYGIAKMYDITVEEILDWNGLKKNESIKPGQRLLVTAPVEVGVLEDYEESPLPPPSNNERVHVVQPDDTYYSISKKYGTTIDDILQRNRLKLDDPIRPYQEIIVPFVQKNKVETPVPNTSGTYIVQAGDTFYKIARENGLSVEQLMRINGKEKPDLAIGEILKIKE